LLGIARSSLAPTEIPVAVITALLGGPFFIWLLRARRRRLPSGPHLFYRSVQ